MVVVSFEYFCQYFLLDSLCALQLTKECAMSTELMELHFIGVLSYEPIPYPSR